MLALVGGAAKAIGGGIVKNVAKDKAKSFITGKKKKVKPEAIKKGDDSSTPGKGGSALAVRPKTSLVPSVAPVSASEVSSESKSSGDTLTLIKTKVFEIDKFLKGTLAQEKASSKKTKKSDEKQKRTKQEGVLEKIAPKPKGILNKITAPAKGLFDGIFNFISNILLGRLLVTLIKSRTDLPGGSILMFIAGTADKIIDVILGTLDAFGSFLAFGQQKLDGAKDWLKEHRGNDAVERFDGLLGSLTNLFNAAVIVGSVFAALGIGGKGKGKGKGSSKNKLTKSQILKNQRRLVKGTSKKAIERYTKRYGAEAAKRKFGSAGQAAANRLGLGRSQIIKGGLGRTTTRLVGKTLGPQAMKAVGPIIKKLGAGFSRVPIVGSLIVAVSSLLAGEPLGQAAFKGLGSALGGFAGSFIPIPIVGTLIGTTIGTFIGDVLYSLILGKGPKEAGEKFKKGISDAFKTMFDLGGLAVNLIKDGFGRLIENFPTVDIPEMAGLQSLLGRFAGLFGVKDDSEFMEDGRIVKLPNLALLTPPGLPFLVPHIAASFLPDIFGEGGVANKIFGEGGTAWGGSGDDTPAMTSGGSSGGTEPHVDEPKSVSQTGNASGKTGKNGNAIYLHWTAGNYTSTGGPYHTVFTGDGTMHRKTEYTQRSGHTEGRNTNSVGLALASNPDINQWPTKKQKVAMAKEGARIAKGWGWSSSDINLNKVLTHGEAGSNLDGVNATTNYGLFGRGDSRVQPEKEKLAGGSIAAFERWDLDIMKEGDKYGSGGDEMRNRIKGFMKLGGPTKGRGLYEMGEEGMEFVLDNDSYMAIESALPGALSIANKAKGKDAVEALMSYTDYERPPEPEMAMAGASSGGGSGSYGDSGGGGMSSSNVSEGSSDTDSSWKDIRYKFG